MLNEVPMVVVHGQPEIQLLLPTFLVNFLALLSSQPELLEREGLLLLMIGEPLGEGRDINPS